MADSERDLLRGIYFGTVAAENGFKGLAVHLQSAVTASPEQALKVIRQSDHMRLVDQFRARILVLATLVGDGEMMDRYGGISPVLADSTLKGGGTD